MSEMVERVKRVILEEYNNLVEDKQFFDDECWRKSARRIIAEMRQPTDEMLDAYFGTYEGTPREIILKCWQAGIDAALK